jgi:hypothetical protein
MHAYKFAVGGAAAAAAAERSRRGGAAARPRVGRDRAPPQRGDFDNYKIDYL